MSSKEPPMSMRERNLRYEGAASDGGRARLFERAMKATEGKNNAETPSPQKSAEDASPPAVRT